MTKKKLCSLLFILGLCAFFYMRSESSQPVSHASKAKSQVTLNTEPNTALGPIKADTPQRAPASVGYVNTPSPDWEERLQESMRIQGGKSLKEIKIKTEKSFVWTREQNPLLVHSVVVTLIDQQEAQSSFRAIIDSQTGHILESWDQTISDPADVRGGFRIKLDPRYTN